MTPATPPRESSSLRRRRTQPSWAIHSADGVRIAGGTAGTRRAPPILSPPRPARSRIAPKARALRHEHRDHAHRGASVPRARRHARSPARADGPISWLHPLPACRFTLPVGLPGIACPQCSGPIVERHAKKIGRAFWPCGRRECDFVSWTKPHPCKACGASCFGAEPERLEPDAAPDPAIPPRVDEEVPF